MAGYLNISAFGKNESMSTEPKASTEHCNNLEMELSHSQTSTLLCTSAESISQETNM